MQIMQIGEAIQLVDLYGFVYMGHSIYVIPNELSKDLPDKIISAMEVLNEQHGYLFMSPKGYKEYTS